jgi:hypothetical protein
MRHSHEHSFARAEVHSNPPRKKEVRDATGIDLGDAVGVTLERDQAPRVVEVPPALLAALERDSAAKAVFDAFLKTQP